MKRVLAVLIIGCGVGLVFLGWQIHREGLLPSAEDVQERINAAEAAAEARAAQDARRRRQQEEWLEEERRAYRTITQMCGDVLPAWWGAHAAVISPSNKQVAECLEKWKAQAEGK